MALIVLLNNFGFFKITKKLDFLAKLPKNQKTLNIFDLINPKIRIPSTLGHLTQTPIKRNFVSITTFKPQDKISTHSRPVGRKLARSLGSGTDKGNLICQKTRGDPNKIWLSSQITPQSW
jgi:hypothetical protein